jgi:hypothetical protein
MRCRDLSRPRGCHRARDDKYEHDRNLHNERADPRPQPPGFREFGPGAGSDFLPWVNFSSCACEFTRWEIATFRRWWMLSSIHSFFQYSSAQFFSLGDARFADGFIRSNGCRPHAVGVMPLLLLCLDRSVGQAIDPTCHLPISLPILNVWVQAYLADSGKQRKVI